MYSVKPVPVLYPEQAQYIDQHCQEAFGLPLSWLMENAGRGIADILVEDEATTVLFVVGIGNNGADGLVAARHLLERGIAPLIYVHGPIERASDLFAKQWQIVESLGIPVVPSLDGLDWTQISHVVEGLIGTGLKGDLRDDMREVLYTMNAFARAHACALWAIDLPAGLDATSGQVDEATPVYTGTITFGAYKLGQWLYPGRSYCGAVEVMPLGLPWEDLLVSDGYRAYLLDQEFVAGLIEERSPLAHKGINGHVGLVGGSPDMPGAPAIAANAAVYSGAGKSTVIAPTSTISGLQARLIPEVMMQSYDSLASLESCLGGKDVLALGPGLGRSQEAKDIVHRVLEKSPVNLVIDADAFYALDEDDLGADTLAGAVLTPHIGEFAHITGESTKKTLKNYIEMACHMAEKTYATWVVKGIPSVVVTPDKEVFINPIGNPGMGSGGMGDALTGMIGAYIAQGYRSKEAALIATYLHSKAADRLAETQPWGYTASDVSREAGKVVSELMKGQA